MSSIAHLPIDVSDQYRMLRPLGQGATGHAFVAEHLGLAIQVVVKVVHDWLAGSPDQVEGMRRVAQALARIDHPNITRVLDFQQTPSGRVLIVSPYLPGQSLAQELMARGGWLPIDEALGRMGHALAGLAAAHEANLIHRALKPSNLHVTDRAGELAREGALVPSPRVRLLDFGAAACSGAPAGPWNRPAIVGDGPIVVGSPAQPSFLAPEQVADGYADHRSDLYALGMVLYVLLAGRGPFDDEPSSRDLLRAHVQRVPEPPSRYSVQAIAPALDALVLRCLAKDAADRYQSARELAGEIDELAAWLRAPDAGQDQRLSCGAPGAAARPLAAEPSPQSAGAAAPVRHSGTTAIGDELAAQLRAAAATPFEPEPAAGADAAPASAVGGLPQAGTKLLSDEEAAAVRARAAMPFDRGTAPAVASQAVIDAPAPRHSGTAALSDEQRAALRNVAAMPFGPAPSAAEPPAWAAAEQHRFPGTAPLSEEHAAALRAQAVTPFGAVADGGASEHLAFDESRALQVINQTPIRIATLLAELRPARPSLVVIAKATCRLGNDGRVELQSPCDWPTGDVEWTPGGSLRYPSDFAAAKQKADVVLLGHAHAPRGRSPAALAALAFGHPGNRFERRVAVFGDRHWKRALLALGPTAPEPFATMPLCYERAFGGVGYAANPVGVGYRARSESDGVARLPNLEDPDALIASPSDVPATACFGPLAPSWRAPHAFDSHWRQHRWPRFPERFDWGGFQCGPPQQQLELLRGDEPFQCVGLRPGGGKLQGRLPGIAVRCLVSWRPPSRRDEQPLELRLDTVVMDLDDGTLQLVWRGSIQVGDRSAGDVLALRITVEPLGGRPARFG